MGAGWCRRMLAIGVGGTARRDADGQGSLMEPIDMAELKRAPEKQGGGNARRALRQGQRARIAQGLAAFRRCST